MSEVSIVIPVHGATECLKNLIEDLDNSEAQHVDKIFVDDASTEDTLSPIIKYMRKDPKVQLLRNEKQNLFTRTLNRGIRACSGYTKYYCCLNTDVSLRPGWLNKLIETMNKYPNTAIVGYPDGKYVEEGPDEEVFFPEKTGYTSYVTGHCFIVPRIMFEKYGLFCETDINQVHISSERLWCYKALSDGCRGFYVHSPLTEHDHGGASWHRDLGWLGRFDKTTLWEGRNTV